jgi:hypothetical protein
MSAEEPANWFELTSSLALVVAACVGSLTLFDDTLLRATVGGLLIAVAGAMGFRIAQPNLRQLVIRRRTGQS